ncbi:MAG: phosphoglycerate kinase [Deltaproteobacteria bacterium]|nr:phosphoglycerate kinase [Deltaproteobacteria bacterium]
MKQIKDIDCSKKRVFLRTDFNVPMDDKLNITDDSRIKRALPTINYLIDNNAAIIIASHLGRPKGSFNSKLSLKPAANWLSDILGKKVTFCNDFTSAEGKKLIDNIKPGEILFLENLRFYSGEEKNDPNFAKQLANICDIYVNDAFGLAHRAHASVSAITKFAKVASAGFLLYRECNYLKKAMQNPKRPLVAIIGGAKISSKIGALKNLLNYADKIIIAGAIANTFLKVKGIDIKASKIDEKAIEDVKLIIKTAEQKNIPIHLPEDCVAAERIASDALTFQCRIDEMPENFMALDIGLRSFQIFEKALKDAKTIIWSGTFGVFELFYPFGYGTESMVNIITKSPAFTLIGGGDTAAAIKQLKFKKKASYISTGGGAFLSFLSGQRMPAIEALK